MKLMNPTTNLGILENVEHGFLMKFFDCQSSISMTSGHFLSIFIFKKKMAQIRLLAKMLRTFVHIVYIVHIVRTISTKLGNILANNQKNDISDRHSYEMTTL